MQRDIDNMFLLFFTFEDVDIRKMDGVDASFVWEFTHKKHDADATSRTRVPTSEKAVFKCFCFKICEICAICVT